MLKDDVQTNWKTYFELFFFFNVQNIPDRRRGSRYSQFKLTVFVAFPKLVAGRFEEKNKQYICFQQSERRKEKKNKVNIIKNEARNPCRYRTDTQTILGLNQTQLLIDSLL